jgi:Lamin Tail Domain
MDLATSDQHAFLDLAPPIDQPAPSDQTPPIDQSALPDQAPPLDQSTPLDQATPVDQSLPPDLNAPADLSLPARPDLAAAADLAGACHPLVNELMVGTAQQPTEEFVELYNPCQMNLPLNGWKLVYRSANNVNAVDAAGDSTLLFDFAAKNVTLPAGGYLVYGGAVFHAGYPGISDGVMSSQLAAGGGAVGLRDAAGRLVDSVGYTTVNAMNAFVETAAAPAPPTLAPPGNSIGRLPNGADTDDNAKDWRLSMAITPKKANQ